MASYYKDFEAWHPIKKHVNERYNQVPTFKRREVWWCSTGINIGVEQDGKNSYFERPVLIVRKFNRRLFWGVPLSTKIKDFPHYVIMAFIAKKENEPKERSFIISQMRAFDSLRLTRPLGKLTQQQFSHIMCQIEEALK